jgi:hypothetical protein
MTMLTRKDLDKAPGFLFGGPERGSGKTTLAAILYAIATGRKLPAINLNGDEKDEQKLYSALRASPEAILIDNLKAASEFSSEVISTVLTAEVYCTRVFHTQTMGGVNTNVVLILTGNSIGFDEDLASRFLPLKFSATRPSKWSNDNWFEWALSIREEARLAAQFIQRAYIRHGSTVGTEAVAKAATDQRFPAWARRVRDPLLWAGGADVGQTLLDNEVSNPHRQEEASFLALLLQHVGARPFTAGEVAAFVHESQQTVLPIGSFERAVHTEMQAVLKEIHPAALGKNGALHMGRFFSERLRRWHRSDGDDLRLETGWVIKRPGWRIVTKAADGGDKRPAIHGARSSARGAP